MMAWGQVKLKGPGDGVFTNYDLGPSPHERKNNSGPGGYWEAGFWGNGSIKPLETYAYCAGS